MVYYFEWVYSTLCGMLHDEPYCKEWDSALSALLDKYGDDAVFSKHTAKIGGHEIWVSNRFYSYGHIYRCEIEQRRPSIRTMIRLAKLQDAAKAIHEKQKSLEYQSKIKAIG